MNTPADLSPLLEAFFTQRLIAQRKVSPHTINSYRDTFSLLLKFAETRLRCPPSKLTLENLAAPFLAAFLDHLETTRAKGPRDTQALVDLTQQEHATIAAEMSCREVRLRISSSAWPPWPAIK